ncbi:MAG: PPC domain-containing DNA-binding protein [Casimicrobiaceae bacterium]
MKTKLLSNETKKTWAVILETGEEVMACVSAFAKQQKLQGSRLTGIGAFERAVLGYFVWEKREYKRIAIDEQVELLSLIGDIALGENGEPKLHAHVVLGRSDGSTLGGHLLEAYVRPTLELMIVEAPVHLRRRFDPDSGLALISS